MTRECDERERERERERENHDEEEDKKKRSRALVETAMELQTLGVQPLGARLPNTHWVNKRQQKYSQDALYIPQAMLLAQGANSVDVLDGEHTTTKSVLQAHGSGARVVGVVRTDSGPDAGQVHGAINAVGNRVKAHTEQSGCTTTLIPVW